MAVVHPAVVLRGVARASFPNCTGEAREGRVPGRGKLPLGHPTILGTTLNYGLAGGGLLAIVRHGSPWVGWTGYPLRMRSKSAPVKRAAWYSLRIQTAPPAVSVTPLRALPGRLGRFPSAGQTGARFDEQVPSTTSDTVYCPSAGSARHGHAFRTHPVHTSRTPTLPRPTGRHVLTRNEPLYVGGGLERSEGPHT